MKRLIAALLCVMMLTGQVSAEEEKLLALTFDDGPSGRFTRRLLEGLEKRGARATFLLCGYRMEVYPELTERIAREDHEIGLHGYSHCAMDDMCPCDLEDEIHRTMALIPEGCRVSFLRPPGGKGGKTTGEAAKNWGLSVLYWSVDPKDWACGDAAVIASRVTKQARSGDVVLLHDMSDSSVDAALCIVDTLQKKGFRFVTVSELAAAKGIDLHPGEDYWHFR